MRSSISIGALLALAIILSGFVAADEGRIEIGPTETFPFVIDSPGSYVLTADLTVVAEDVDAIQITASDVTLDLAGHVIKGPNAGTGRGISSSSDRENIRIRDGVIREFHKGIEVAFGSVRGGQIIENITASRNLSSGIAVNMAIVARCSAYGNGGNGITVGFGSVVRHSYASYNTGHGIELQQASAVDCVADNNGGDGIRVDTFLGGALISGCNVFSNTGHGIYLGANDNSNVVNCVGSGNTLGNIVNCGVGNGCHQNYLP